MMPQLVRVRIRVRVRITARAKARARIRVAVRVRVSNHALPLLLVLLRTVRLHLLERFVRLARIRVGG